MAAAEGEVPAAAVAKGSAAAKAPVEAAAEAEQVVPVEIWSLRLGQAYAAKLVGKPIVKVCAVNLHHAAALEATLSDQVQKKEWVVEDLHYLRSLSNVERLLISGIDGLVPTVADNKGSPSYLLAWKIWSRTIQGAAAEIPGKFPQAIKELCVQIRQVVDIALNGNPTEAWLDGKLEEFLTAMNTLKTSCVYLVDKEEYGGDEDEEEDEDEEVVMEEDYSITDKEVVVEIFSLQHGQESAVGVKGQASVRIWGVDMRDAGALEALLMEQVAKKSWVVPELEQLGYIARLDLLLSLALYAHVPIVGQNLSTAAYLCAFRDWSWEVQSVALKALRQDKFESVKQLLQKVRRLVKSAFKGRSPDLNRKLQEIWMSLRDLKNGFVYL